LEDTSYSNRDDIRGFEKHVYRNRTKKVVTVNSIEHIRIVHQQPKKSRNRVRRSTRTEEPKTVKKKKRLNEEDYLLQKRIEREINPDMHFK